jgi:amidase
MVPFAHANDGGGSIRIPASCCGLFGLKPTRARITYGPLLGDVQSGLVQEHAVTRSVRDSAALLDATEGPMPGDPYFAPPKERPYLEEVGRDPGKLRIAFATTTSLGTPLDEEAIAAVKDAAALCEELGHDVVEASPQVNGAQLVPAFTALWASGNAWGIDSLAMLTGKQPKADDFEPLTWALYEMGKALSAPAYLQCITMLQIMGRTVAAFHEQYDVWLTPTLAAPPPPLGYFDAEPNNPMAGFTKAADYVPFTPVQNVTGQPAMSVPLYWTNDGLPLGAHFVAKAGGEGLLFRLAAQLEEARPWAGRIPPPRA